VSPAAAAAAGAAAAANNAQPEESTDWGWVAFGILAGAVLIGAIVWFVRRRNRAKQAGAQAPDTPQLPTQP
jgi:LPXTG-motif cell wall-anchored protein